MKDNKVKIGVFDSGVGGQSVVNAIQKALPELEIIYAADKENVPYGNKKPEELHELVLPILHGLVEQGCQIIVIACNSVTTTLIERLRAELPVPLIGMEPMIKPAVNVSRSKVIAVFATATTLASKRYKWLKAEYAKGVEVIEPDCSDWAYTIENKEVDREKIANRIEEACGAGADVIVLGCTHYHWIEKLIKQIAAGRAVVLQPEQPVIAQLQNIISTLPKPTGI